MGKCYLCENEITKENETEEHIILNAIGGTLKSKNLICKQCNSKLGNDIDSILADQLNYLSNLLNIKRDRYQVPNLEAKSTSTGENILLKPGGKPIMKFPIKYEYTDENNQKRISVKSPNIKQARKMLTGLKRRCNQIDIEKTLSEAKLEQRFLNENYKISIAIEGNKLFPSICKMGINLYMLNGGSREFIKHLIPYILGKENLDCVQFYYHDMDVILKNEDEVLHSIIIKSDTTQRLLLAYIELFNCYKFVVLLNENYSGSDFSASYYFDVIERREVKKHNNFSTSKSEILSLVKSYTLPINEIITEIQKILNLAYKKQENDFILSALEKAKKNSFDKYSEDQVYTEEMGEEFVNELMKKLTPWLADKISRSKNQNSKN